MQNKIIIIKIHTYIDTIKYLGIIIDRRFNFNEHMDNITGKRIKIIHALSKSAKIYWGKQHDVLRIIQGVTGGTDQTSGGCSLC